MKSPIAKVSINHLETFLSQNGELWDAEGSPSFNELISSIPMTVYELVSSILSYANHDVDYVYLFSDHHNPNEVVNQDGYRDKIELIDVSGLEEFVISCVRGKDFLWISPTDVDLSNGTYITILLHQSEDEESED